MNAIITGHDAIRLSERDGLKLRKYTDPVEGYREGLSVSEAREIVAIDASLIYVVVTHAGWTPGQNDGVNVTDYFKGCLDGHAMSGATYLGPDEFGLEPTWIDVN